MRGPTAASDRPTGGVVGASTEGVASTLGRGVVGASTEGVASTLGRGVVGTSENGAGGTLNCAALLDRGTPGLEEYLPCSICPAGCPSGGVKGALNCDDPLDGYVPDV